MICKTLGITPSSDPFRNLSRPERLWLLLNIRKDEDLENQKFMLTLKHILPQAYAQQDQEEVIVSTEYIKEIEEKLGRQLTTEEIDGLEANEDLDFIG